MYRINFNIETISVFEIAQSRLDSVFSMWYEDDSGAKIPTLSDSFHAITFPTIKIAENDSSWLTPVGVNTKVSFDSSSHAIKVKVGDESEKLVYSHDYINNIEFGVDAVDKRTIIATITFESSNGRYIDNKFTKFRTIN
jgi:hypothetical protein